MRTRARWGLVLALACGDCSAPPPPRFNLLLVSIDTLRKEHVSCYGYARATTPNIDRLAAEGLVFDAASTPRAKTTPALASLFTGLYPHEHGVRELLQPLGRSTVLAETLRQAGYRSAAIVGNFVLQDRYCGLARGFDAYVESLPSKQGVPPDDVAQRTARSLTQGGLVALGLEPAPAQDEDGRPFEPRAALVDPAQPWFLWLHYMDPHGAYEPPPEHRVFRSDAPRWIDPRQAPAAPGRKLRISDYNVPPSARAADGRIDTSAVVDLYDAEIRYADGELGRLLDALRARGDLARTWVVVTADHGESLGEQDYFFEHGFYAYEATNAVPLIVRPPDQWKDRPAPGRRAGGISLADVGPTLQAALLGRTEPRWREPIQTGRSKLEQLLGNDVDSATYGEKVEGANLPNAVQVKTVRRGRWKLHRRFARNGDASRSPAPILWLGEELYDLAADPLEARDLAASPPEEARVDELRALLLRFIERDAPFTAEIRADPEAQRALRALGY